MLAGEVTSCLKHETENQLGKEVIAVFSYLVNLSTVCIRFRLRMLSETSHGPEVHYSTLERPKGSLLMRIGFILNNLLSQRCSSL